MTPETTTSALRQRADPAARSGRRGRAPRARVPGPGVPARRRHASCFRGAVRDQKPAGLYVESDPDPLTFHHMQVELEVAFPDAEITAATVLFEAHPHDTVRLDRPALRQPGRAVDRPRLHPRGAPALRWAARLHPHDGVAAGDGAGGDPEHLVDADRRGPAGGTPSWRRPSGPLAGGAPATLGGDAQQLPRVGRDGRVRPARPRRR